MSTRAIISATSTSSCVTALRASALVTLRSVTLASMVAIPASIR